MRGIGLFGPPRDGYGGAMANHPRPRRTPFIGRLALVGAQVLVLGVAACGDMQPPKDAVGGVTTASSAPTGEQLPTTGSSGSADSGVSAVIGAWSARYGSARNEVQTALSAVGSAAAQGSAAVKTAATDALAALKDADAVPPCPDDATEQAYRTALQDLTAKATEVKSSGDATAAQQLATDGTTAFDATEQALLAVYG